MFPADKSIRNRKKKNSMELAMMKPYLCISANIKTVFYSAGWPAGLTWTGEKHFAFPLLPTLLNCGVQR